MSDLYFEKGKRARDFLRDYYKAHLFLDKNKIGGLVCPVDHPQSTGVQLKKEEETGLTFLRKKGEVEGVLPYSLPLEVVAPSWSSSTSHFWLNSLLVEFPAGRALLLAIEPCS